MAGTDIKLTPEELIAQSTELTSLQTEFESVFSQLTSTLNSMNDSWSATLAGNFAGKIQAAQKSFTSVAKHAGKRLLCSTAFREYVCITGHGAGNALRR
ncbi:MAG: WXG100 family type VII secretion target [Lachnospiraceae bacterium]